MILTNLFSALMHFLYITLRFIYALIRISRPPNIPPIKNPLLKLSVTTLARKIRNGELSSQIVVEAYIERIKEVNPYLNAVIEDRFEAAINDAKTYDMKLKAGEVTVSMLELEKPLFGVPVTVKESCSVKGLSLTGGTLARKGVKAAEDGPAVQTLRKAGAIPLCVTNTPELCTAINTSNFLFGTTRNPYDRRKSSGGSSGGEGALLGAGASILGIGSDLVGSIRIPCLFNGICGHKPTPGIISNEGHLPRCEDPTFLKFLTIGPMARYMEDLHLAVKVLSSKCEKQLRLNDPVDLRTLRIFYIDNFNSNCGILSTTSDVRRRVKEATRYLAKIGAHVEELSQDWVNDMLYMVTTIFETDLPYLFLDSEHSEKKKKSMLELFKGILGQSQYTMPLIFMQLLKDTHALVPYSEAKHYINAREELRQRLNSLLKDDGVIICPTFPEAAPYANLGFFLCSYTTYCAFANIMEMPATQVPMGLNDEGMPVGIQVMGASHEDRLCLAVAKELEKAFGGWVPPPS